VVLEKDSSVLGYPGEISTLVDGDYHGVCKHESPNDPRYITVRNVLKSLVGKAKRKGMDGSYGAPGVVTVLTRLRNTDEPQAGASQAVGSNFEEYLSVPESPDGDYNFFRDHWTSGTCNWILSHEALPDG
jgi:hypothetical protein